MKWVLMCLSTPELTTKWLSRCPMVGVPHVLAMDSPFHPIEQGSFQLDWKLEVGRQPTVTPHPQTQWSAQLPGLVSAL